MRGVGGNARWALVVAGCAAILPLAACGGGDKQDEDEPSGDFTVQVTRASFPKQQELAQPARMTITVRNTGGERVPNLAVTLRSTVAGAPAGGSTAGSGAQGAGIDAFSYRSGQQGVADPSRPIWIVDRGPKQVLSQGPGGGVTAYVATWALGALDPGKTKSFTWDVTPVRAGTYGITWRVSAGLDGKARARAAGGGVPQGRFGVSISPTPSQSSVDDDGNIIREPGASQAQSR